MNEAIIECPCYRVCSALGVDMGQWCRYRKSDLPPPGMHAFNPKDTWCPPGIQASILMLAHLVAGGSAPPDALADIRHWAQQLRPRQER